MLRTAKKIVRNAIATVGLGYNLIRGVDYRTLSQYILRINAHKSVDDILFEVSQCLKQILDYELFGFVLKNGTSLDLWIDPRMYGSVFTEYVSRDFKGQNIDCTVHYFEKKSGLESHISDEIDVNKLVSYSVMENKFVARLYLLPKKKMLNHHDAIIGTIISSLNIALEKNLSIQQLENAVAIDPLTDCYNRRAFNTFIDGDIAYAQRNNRDLSVIMFDMDNFKAINDTHGHQAGDAVLKTVSALIHSLVRKSDYLARYGGEEFVLVLPDTSLYSAVHLAEKLRKQVEGCVVTQEGTTIPVTASFGVASLHHHADSSGLLRDADQRLYEAKESGRNKVVPELASCFDVRKDSVDMLLGKYASHPQVA